MTTAVGKFNSLTQLEESPSEKRLDEILDMITSIAELNFRKSLPILGDGSKIDAIASGLNMLSEELAYSVTSKKELELKNAIIESIVENIPVAVFLKDARDNFRIGLWNKAAEAIFEIPRETVIGKVTHDLWSKDHADSYLADDIMVTKNGISINIPEEPAATKKRGLICLHTRKIPLRIGDDEEVSYLLGICEDITEQKNAQNALVATSKMAGLGEMAGNIAHEINNPLTIIRGKARMIKEQIKAENIDIEKLRIDSSKIEETVEWISKIITGLSFFSRNSKSDPMKNTNLLQIIQNTQALCQERFKSNSVNLQVICDEDLWLECRPSQIAQIIMNLLNNALDAVETLPEKWVTLAATASDKLITVSVIDSGKGILNVIAEKMMQPFVTTKDTGKGTGLGLSISKAISTGHHGDLYYDASSANTRFVLELPIQQSKVLIQKIKSA